MSDRPIRTIIANQEIATASSSMSVLDAARVMKQKRTGALLVCDKRRLVGVFTERDALFRVTAEGRDPDSTLLAEVMTPHPQTIGPDKPLGHALHMMYEGGFRNVPVVENGRPIGMVSARDALGPELKEFVLEMDEREHIAEILG
ncbi:MAG TPA: CBS domain-containing protein [Burkholderiales bacterium]|jgi:CBS domain-containing protein|nr:CBS domain-containing protein [Burkholderiales bacterium]